ncbi:MAG: DUF3391 domain-containing protein [Comamonas sp.]|nr:DUF3391 domain-containing protein [Comamonas sp.]
MYLQNGVTVPDSVLINIGDLRVGMYVRLEIGWMNHPFPTSSFRIASLDQIQVLRDLGLREVRYVPSRSVVAGDETGPAADAPASPASGGAAPADEARAESLDGPSGQPGAAASAPRDDVARKTNSSLQSRSHARFQEAAALYADVVAGVQATPTALRERVQDWVRDSVAELMETENYAVHLLAQVAGQRQVKHSVNVMVLAMLLGRSLNLGAASLRLLGAAGLLHDIGKIDLPAHIAAPGAALSVGDRRLYEEHVQRSMVFAQRMGFDADLVQAIGEHHEMVDGSGFPKGSTGAQISRHGQILALVNRYDRLCNPLHGEASHTPHEALARLFSQERKRFDPSTVLAAFIRMMGVYPPGSIVQLGDGRFARVVASNAQSPLRPCVLPFVAGVSLSEARELDLGPGTAGGIRRSVKCEALPDEVLEFFQPAQQMCYFFERMPRQPESESAAR